MILFFYMCVCASVLRRTVLLLLLLLLLFCCLTIRFGLCLHMVTSLQYITFCTVVASSILGSHSIFAVFENFMHVFSATHTNTKLDICHCCCYCKHVQWQFLFDMLQYSHMNVKSNIFYKASHPSTCTSIHSFFLRSHHASNV